VVFVDSVKMSHVLVEFIEDNTLSVQKVSDIDSLGDKLPEVNAECVIWWAPSAKKKAAKYAAKVLLYGGECICV